MRKKTWLAVASLMLGASAMVATPGHAITVGTTADISGLFGLRDGYQPAPGVVFQGSQIPNGVSEKTCDGCHDAIATPFFSSNGFMSLQAYSQAVAGPGDGSATATTQLAGMASVTNTNSVGDPLEVILDWNFTYLMQSYRSDPALEQATGSVWGTLVRQIGNAIVPIASLEHGTGEAGVYDTVNGFLVPILGDDEFFTVTLEPGETAQFIMSVYADASALRSSLLNGSTPENGEGKPPPNGGNGELPPVGVIPLPATGWLLLGALGGLAALRRRQRAA